MPYAADHKDKTRARIVDSARVLFNRHGFESVASYCIPVSRIIHAG